MIELALAAVAVGDRLEAGAPGDCRRAPLAQPRFAALGVGVDELHVEIVVDRARSFARRILEHHDGVDRVLADIDLIIVLHERVLTLDRRARQFRRAGEGHGEAALRRLELGPLRLGRRRGRGGRLVLGPSERGRRHQQERRQGQASDRHARIPSSICARFVHLRAERDERSIPRVAKSDAYPCGCVFSTFSYIASTSALSARRESGRR